MRLQKITTFALTLLIGCGGGGGSTPGGPPSTPTPVPSATPSPGPQANFYEPLALGDTWTYTCRDIKGGGENGGNAFTITDTVVGTTTVGSQAVFEFSLQIPQVPSAPLAITTQIQLLANDALGNVTLYGYLVGGAIVPVTPTLFVTATPPAGTNLSVPFNYPGPSGTSIDRTFIGITNTNPTPLGTFRVAPYFESSSTHNYGYALGVGIAEEDHGPNFEVDCLIASVSLH